MSRPAGHQARKRFGQNFLEDANIIRAIIRIINPKPQQALVEIGPGLGALTELLLETTGGHLAVVELDRDLIPVLRTKFFNYPHLRIHQADALKFDFPSLAQAEQKLRIVGNLPYNISTPLIFHLISCASSIQDMHFMLQKEVVERLAAQPGCKDYGRLGIMVQYHCRVESLLDVPPTAFNPRPKVESAVVKLTPYMKPPIPARDIEVFEKVVRSAFAQRRKTLRNNLKSMITDAQLEALNIDPSIRAENLTLQNFVAISDTLTL
ncbi:MAG: 16S rRNA (adenine(1518)-N(6)/adenine(1519)-N(6))-dimethyltransferase RsmA [Pseudomonadales bacterium]|nr:16S rRNA (adenine(1518)-N(6)/adenine(1519)-N(6))-dimethyltransferase RsmA [Pseudomonadales bacterium]MCP5216239.1 16S rRNA (adenine(1518)-N(6)/adenine(1519)-N(6))-dimethyltransferase RsmA [Pseudomonadales bacterium]